jgi:hypothetical protein
MVSGGLVRFDGVHMAPARRRRRRSSAAPGISLVNGGSAVAAIVATRYSPFDALTRYPKQ